MSEFNLSGKTLQLGESWGAEIVLRTPDGKETKIESGPVCKTDTEASELLEMNIERILAAFKSGGTVVMSHQKGIVQ